jgi:type II secretory pathway pseudopilin PulG
MKRRLIRGLTLTEVIVSMTLFSVVGLLLAVSFTSATAIWRTTSASTSSQMALSKARDDLTRDVQRTSFSTVRISNGPSSLGAVDGDAIWFLSAIDPVSGQMMRKVDGTPFWQRNILYYSVVPNNHATLLGFSCSGGADADGYEVQCPHKVLIRKVIDSGPATDPTDESTEETILTSADVSGTYLTRPNGYNTSNMLSESGVDETSLPSTNLLTFRAQLAPDPQWQREVRLELGAVSIGSAQTEVAIGSSPLDGTRFYSDLILSLFPGLP